MIKGVLAAYLLLLIPAVISWIEKLRLEKDIVISSLRALVQLLILSSVILYFFKLPVIFNILFVFLMLISGCIIATERGRGVPKSFLISFVAMFVSFLPVFILLFFTGVLKLVPNIFVPISGMLLGNATKSLSLVFNRTKKQVEENHEIIEAAFLDGAGYIEASKIFMIDVMNVALIPQIDGLKILGIVHIPGTMAGLLIGGVKPIDAAFYQLIVAYSIASIYVFTTFIGAYLSFLLLLKKRYEQTAGL